MLIFLLLKNSLYIITLACFRNVLEQGKITEEEFEVAKASGAIIGCVVPDYKKIPDEEDLMDWVTLCVRK